MKKKEVLSFIYLAEAYDGKKDSEILSEISENKIEGEIINGSSFIYKIGEDECVIPINRIWNYTLSTVKGKTNNEFLRNLKKVLENYIFPTEILKQLSYVNPETKKLEYLPEEFFIEK